MKKIASVASILAVSASLFAVEFNGILADDTSIKFSENTYDESAFEQAETFTGNIRIPFTSTGNVYFTAEGNVKHKLATDFPDMNDTDNSITADLSLLKVGVISSAGSGKIQFNAGRFYVSDVSGIVLSQTSDGVMFSFDNQHVGISAYGGYTGLLNSKNTSILLSSGAAGTLKDEKDVYDFCYPYIAGGITVSAPFLFLNQSLTAEGFAFIPTEGIGNYLEEDENARIYASLNLNGPISPIVFYSLTGTAGFNDGEAGCLAQLDVSVYPEFMSSSITVSGKYASSDFTSFTKGTACSSTLEPAYSGIIKAGIAGSIIPVEKLMISAGADFVLVDNDFSEKYMGCDAQLSVSFQAASDVSLGITGTGFIADESDYNTTKIAFNATIAF